MDTIHILPFAPECIAMQRAIYGWYPSIILTRFGFNEKGEVSSVLSISCPFNAPDLGLCDVYRHGTVVMCNNGVVSEFSVKDNNLVTWDITSMFPPLDYRYAGAVISYHGKIWIATNRGFFNSAKQQYPLFGY